jgi:oligopeptide/dipeptide ABC transporter ATP-binding protein
MVLYRGQVMELGEAGAVYSQPVHPYTQALLDASPVPDPELQRRRRAERRQRRRAEAVQSPSLGCPFAPRCPHAVDVCRERRPAVEPTTDGRLVACHRWRELPDFAAARPGEVGVTP